MATHQEIRTVGQPDSIIGWTAANAVKRAGLDAAGTQHLATMYESLIDLMPERVSVQWRVVHALGASQDDTAIDTLLDALDQDKSKWVSYGAARSLVEIAATATPDSGRSRILSELLRRIVPAPGEGRSPLHPMILEEIVHTGFYRGAPGDWKAEFLGVVSAIADSQRGSRQSEKWRGLRGEFEAWDPSMEFSYGD